jgi:hypothetical protein
VAARALVPLRQIVSSLLIAPAERGRGRRSATVPTLLLLSGAGYANLKPVNRLTKQEQLVLCLVIGLLLMGWAVKAYRTAHPPSFAAESLKL